jgi:DNA-binding NtrC family response regulator
MNKRITSIRRTRWLLSLLTGLAIRELENFIERAVILTRGSSLTVPLAELKSPRGARRCPLSTLEEAERERSPAPAANQLARRRSRRRRRPPRHEADDATVEDGEVRHRAPAAR